jgi:hypothetical protein
MLVTNVIYLIIFIVVAVKTRNGSNGVGILPYGTAPSYVRTQPVVNQTQPSTTYVSPSSEQRNVKCPNCHTVITYIDNHEIKNER